ncbi:intradiol ring-cleavage dioxygenase [Aurantimonas sp. VKM B-3413]|uniref:intradiol ring-cleavage dioxygenase n=1 Tax=Aurantimonas sp. VKM B-3413 TaxID=2779401 RepID=UPI001E4AC563|nr:intradiol ring-cleavage dioxygenase [Aurantimonas sp. VKM B-3413]MCB8838790.1 intradiol ring-cleavage dioxygenase [Aurantimonas sp. VKM B-3413]
MTSFDIGRRELLALTGATVLGAAMLPRAVLAAASPAAASRLLPGTDVCRLTPEVTAGPFYFDPKLVREDITEDRRGVPVRLLLQVVDRACAPIRGARVDVWHCDASGLYSNYAGQGDDPAHPASTEGETFLRGTQVAGRDGIVSFRTIYPGWYPGRTTHIHFKVFTDAKTRLTGQVFFPDALSSDIYANVAPYSERPAMRDTFNGNDWIARRAGDPSFAFVKEAGRAYEVALIIGIDPAA